MHITVYDHSTSRIFDNFIENFHRRNCVHYPSDIFKDENYKKEIAINYAINRAKMACSALNVPLAEHFVSVYRAIDEEVYVDWKLSSYAAYMTLINGDPSDPLVAEFQQSVLKKFF